MWNVWPERKVDSATIAEAFKIAEEACRAIAPIFTHDGAEFIVLEFENVYVNYLLLGKKLYATLQYSADLGPEKAKKTVKKGLRCVRRDTIGLARDSQSACIDHITNNRIPEAMEEGRRAVRELFAGKVQMTKLMTSKKISSSYLVNAETLKGEKLKVDVTPHGAWKARDTPGVTGTCDVVPGEPWKMHDSKGAAFGMLTLAQPHVHVMHRVEARARGSGPRVGDRVRYVFVDNKNQTSDLQIARAECPEYAQGRGLRPDAVYYYEHSVRPPLDAVLSLFAKERGCDSELGWSLALITAKNKAEGQSALSAFGFGAANPVKKASKVAKQSSKKRKTVHITKPTVANAITKLFNLK
jgi:DNA polymerase elongation subunit (family B)